MHTALKLSNKRNIKIFHKHLPSTGWVGIITWSYHFKDLIVTNSVTCVQPNGYTSFVRVHNDFNKSISIYFVLIGISKECKSNLTPTSLEPMCPLNTPVRDRRSSLMEIILVLTHSHWWDKATPRTKNMLCIFALKDLLLISHISIYQYMYLKS